VSTQFITFEDSNVSTNMIQDAEVLCENVMTEEAVSDAEKEKNINTVGVIKNDLDGEKCVLCSRFGHIGRDCTELVCILCFARGLSMEECADISVEANEEEVEVIDIDVSEDEPSDNALSKQTTPSVSNTGVELQKVSSSKEPLDSNIDAEEPSDNNLSIQSTNVDIIQDEASENALSMESSNVYVNGDEPSDILLSNPCPVIRLKSLEELLGKKSETSYEMEADKNVVSLEEDISNKFNDVSQLSTEGDSNEVVASKTDDEYLKSDEKFMDNDKFSRLMLRKFRDTTPLDVIALFKSTYCGLCCIKFSGPRFTSKHYNGWGHARLIEKKTFRNKPLYWQMIFHALISVDPAGRSKKSICAYIEDTFSAHLSKDRAEVRANIDLTLQDMVERFQNVVNINLTGVYKLKDRKEQDRPKRPPPGVGIWNRGPKKRMLSPIRHMEFSRYGDSVGVGEGSREERRGSRGSWSDPARIYTSSRHRNSSFNERPRSPHRAGTSKSPLMIPFMERPRSPRRAGTSRSPLRSPYRERPRSPQRSGRSRSPLRSGRSSRGDKYEKDQEKITNPNHNESKTSDKKLKSSKNKYDSTESDNGYKLSEKMSPLTTLSKPAKRIPNLGLPAKMISLPSPVPTKQDKKTIENKLPVPDSLPNPVPTTEESNKMSSSLSAAIRKRLDDSPPSVKSGKSYNPRFLRESTGCFTSKSSLFDSW
jgi:hypothetical protein